MSQSHNPKIVRDGLVLALDAASKKNALNAVEVLVVAGGGGGGARHAGGGGGGGVIYNPNFSIVSGSTITVTVGAGGVGGTETSGWGASPVTTNGGNSVFGSLTSLGGGGGGSVVAGMIGGSGGGGGDTSSGIVLGGAGTVGQGFAGGNSANGSYFGGGGGGGAGAAGSDGINGAGGAGGPGLNFSISGSPTWYAGGGGGAAGYNKGSLGGIGGIGGGGRGDNSGSAGATVQNGTSNTGGGGGAQSTPYPAAGSGKAGNGGSGIVIVRYKGSQKATGGTVTFVNGHTIHTFTTSGTFTPNGIPGIGTIWTDVSKNGNSGTLMNSVGYNSANRGSFVFDGVNDYIDCGNFILNSALKTMSCWVKFNSIAGDQEILSKSSGCAGIELLLYGDSLSFFVMDCVNFGGRFTQISIPKTNLNTTDWFFISVTHNGPSSQMRLHLNNIMVSGIAPSTISDTSLNFLIGTWNGGGRYLNGNISNIQLYDRSLTVAEIKQNFNAHRGRFGI